MTLLPVVCEMCGSMFASFCVETQGRKEGMGGEGRGRGKQERIGKFNH